MPGVQKSVLEPTPPENSAKKRRVAVAADYPEYIFFPRSVEPPSWVDPLVDCFAAVRASIDTQARQRNTSNNVLALVAPGLRGSGYQVEDKGGMIPRPVLFGERGRLERKYQIDAYHAGEKVAVEVEAGRGAKGNAIFRDIIHLALIVDADYAAIAVPIIYRFNVKGKEQRQGAYKDGLDLFDAIFTSRRLTLPFRGVLLIGY